LIIAEEIGKNRNKNQYMPEAIAKGVASGGFCCFYIGGTYIENYQGEKKLKIDEIY
jgi:hypothetical protein